MFLLKKKTDLVNMRKAGKVVVDVLHLMKELIRPGIDTLTLDEKAEELIRKEKAKPAFKGYRVPGIPRPFPGTLCVSINNEVVHGIPSRDRVLEEGDIVSIDVGSFYGGYYGDAAYTYPVGEVSKEKAELLYVTKEALDIAVKMAVPGNTVGDIGHAVETFVKKWDFGIVREYAGHGIGRKLHEPPQIPNYGAPGTGVTLKEGMAIAIEPMVMLGEEKVKTLPDMWTVVTADGSDAAHFEKSVFITEDGPEVLTPWE
ncbi:methionine aminopeptidase, type I [Thermovirga lienii DSM 17291]|jgi:methionyl aminopeptidase|uniref:Methionine aminopeptidase n=1 Tax=Thermovirga lienii (strain ATCC BAA-1197 / DSM 17291 / Cas60314) TaxID=580340 RepID=G7V8W2_THELD|nr:type I methionyl aminopeptidase [Thermovirga lienii]AER66403.1 methionine aminopeptidase, type I [Thermovirga lienii DSM 17291]KUK42462.1 MAG: Methionine aminopeptidase [Thermovirga lienii]MDN5368595.1 methionyl aminopeptidase [Thermovirga sp.]HCD72459.1 type I methionyl aminopeptidase [Thermovirga lienii]